MPDEETCGEILRDLKKSNISEREALIRLLEYLDVKAKSDWERQKGDDL